MDRVVLELLQIFVVREALELFNVMAVVAPKLQTTMAAYKHLLLTQPQSSQTVLWSSSTNFYLLPLVPLELVDSMIGHKVKVRMG
jgi:hypothetical protein